MRPLIFSGLFWATKTHKRTQMVCHGPACRQAGYTDSHGLIRSIRVISGKKIATNCTNYTNGNR